MTKQEYKTQVKLLIENDPNLIIALSPDTLILMKSYTEFGKYLIEGDKTNAYLIEGSIEDITEIIHNCLDARETGIEYRCEIDGIEIIFN